VSESRQGAIKTRFWIADFGMQIKKGKQSHSYFVIQDFDLNAQDNMSATSTDERAVIPGMSAVFLAVMTRNPGISCRKLDSRVRGNDAAGMAFVFLRQNPTTCKLRRLKR
jgi:hypothetical protein